MRDDQRAFFAEQGYVILARVLDPEVDFAPVVAAYDRILDDLGAPGSTLALSPARIAERTAALYAETGSLFSQHLDITLPPRANLPADLPICLDPALFRMLTHPRLLDAVEAVIGPEIAVNPVNHVRIKPPEHLLAQAAAAGYREINVNNKNGMMAQTPLHQDLAVFTPDVDDVEILTVWFPVTPATVETGCLHVIPGSHLQGLRGHCPSTTTDLQIPGQLTPEAPVPLPMAPGDVLFLTRRTVHGSLPNRSASARWSFDLRYQPAGAPNGRAVLPSFTARSRARPESVMTRPEDWADMWRTTRARLSAAPEVPRPNRWSADAPMCA